MSKSRGAASLRTDQRGAYDIGRAGVTPRYGHAPTSIRPNDGKTHRPDDATLCQSPYARLPWPAVGMMARCVRPRQLLIHEVNSRDLLVIDPHPVVFDQSVTQGTIGNHTTLRRASSLTPTNCHRRWTRRSGESVGNSKADRPRLRRWAKYANFACVTVAPLLGWIGLTNTLPGRPIYRYKRVEVSNAVDSWIRHRCGTHEIVPARAEVLRRGRRRRGRVIVSAVSSQESTKR